METVIGFVVGYLVGANEGKGGLERLKVSLASIASSAEARRLVGEAMALAQPVIKKATSSGLGNLSGMGGLSGIGESVVKQIINRVGEQTSRAA
jgi:hypothetical protein